MTALIGAGRTVELVAYGMPGPQGSKRGFAIKRGGKYTGAVAMKESSADKVNTWRSDVVAAGLDAMAGAPPLEGPLIVSMTFTLPKPKSAPKTRRTWPMKYPDLSKLARSTEDALTTAGVWRDDAQVIRYSDLAKVFPGEDPLSLPLPGVRIKITEAVDG